MKRSRSTTSHCSIASGHSPACQPSCLAAVSSWLPSEVERQLRACVVPPRRAVVLPLERASPPLGVLRRARAPPPSDVVLLPVVPPPSASPPLTSVAFPLHASVFAAIKNVLKL